MKKQLLAFVERSSPGRERAREDVKALMFQADWCAEVAGGQNQVLINRKTGPEQSIRLFRRQWPFEARWSFPHEDDQCCHSQTHVTIFVSAERAQVSDESKSKVNHLSTDGEEGGCMCFCGRRAGCALVLQSEWLAKASEPTGSFVDGLDIATHSPLHPVPTRR